MNYKQAYENYINSRDGQIIQEMKTRVNTTETHHNENLECRLCGIVLRHGIKSKYGYICNPCHYRYIELDYPVLSTRESDIIFSNDYYFTQFLWTVQDKIPHEQLTK